MQRPAAYLRTARGAWWISLAGSAFLHLWALGVMVWIFWGRGSVALGPPMATMASGVPLEGAWTLRSLIESAAVMVEQPVDSADHSPTVNPAAPDLEAMIRARLDREIDSAQQQPSEDLLHKLEQLGTNLEKVSTEVGVGEVAGMLQKSLGIKQRSSVPSSGGDIPPGPFDHSTAQVESVSRSTDPEGTVAYLAMMVDAAGHRLVVPLDEAEGKQLYETFELMKRFPLLEQVYRQVMMGLLDKMLADEPLAPVPPPENPNRDK